MSYRKRWWSFAGGAALSAVLLAVSAVGITAAGSAGSARDAHLYVKSLDAAGQGIQSAWSQAAYADALAAIGLAEAARDQFEQARGNHVEHVAVLSASGIEEASAAAAALAAGFAALEQAFNGTVALATTEGTAAAAANHKSNTTAVVAAMAPAFAGLSAISDAAHAKIVGGLDSGAATVRAVSIAGASVGGLALVVIVLAAALWSRRGIAHEKSSSVTDELEGLQKAA